MKIRQLFSCLAIVATLAAVLYPLLAKQRAAGFDPVATCLDRSGDVAQAIDLYCDDNNDRVPPCNYNSNFDFANTANGYWPRLVKPYLNSWNAFRCTADAEATDFFQLTNSGFGPATTQARQEAHRSLFSNRGYNWQYMSPMTLADSVPHPILLAQVATPASTLYFIESSYDRMVSDGHPNTSGFMLVDPPCRYLPGNVDTFPVPTPGAAVLNVQGWATNSPNAWNRWGGGFPWHRDPTTGLREGRTIAAFLDGHVASISMAQAANGCNALPNFGGNITSTADYLWDLN